ncbi:MAG: hypothetical protein ACFFDW_00715 [Candidatus Thorarchaeota archaeon]
MNETEAISKAKDYITKLGYNPSTMKVKVKEYNTPWNPWLRVSCLDEYCVERKRILAGKTYWAVYFSHDDSIDGKRMRGGDVCVFIDVQLGGILTEVRGK